MQRGVSLHVVLAIFSIPENNSRSVRKLILVEEVDGVPEVYCCSSLLYIDIRFVSDCILYIYFELYKTGNIIINSTPIPSIRPAVSATPFALF